MSEFGKKVAFIRDYSTKAVAKFPDCYFDWVYVDAVHDVRVTGDEASAGHVEQLDAAQLVAGHLHSAEERER